MVLQPFVGPWPLLQFRNLFYTDSLDERSARRKAARATQTHNKCTHKHPCLRVGFEPKIPAFERAKTVHALNRAATVTGILLIISVAFLSLSHIHVQFGTVSNDLLVLDVERDL
jgi:hypothetical protein